MCANRIRERLDADEVAFGAKTMTHSPAVIETYGAIGLDYVYIDYEHMGPTPFDSPGFEHLVRAAEGAGIELVPRLPGGDPDLVQKVLDTGVRALLVPKVRTAEEVRRVVRASRFRYDDGVGDRGIGSARANAWGSGKTRGYLSDEDDEVMVGVMIETERAVQAIDDIVDVPHLGFVSVGPADLSLSLDRPLDTDHRDVREAVTRVHEAADAAGVPYHTSVGSAEDARAAVENGASMVRLTGGELAVLRDVVGSRLDAARP